MALVNSFGLQVLFAYFIDGNIQFESISSTVSLLISFLHIATLFFGFAVMIYGTFLFGEKESRRLFFANLIQVAASSFASLAASYFSTTPSLFFYNLGTLLLYLFLNYLIYAVLLLAIRALSVFLLRRTANTDPKVLAPSGRFFSFRHPVLRALLLSTLIYIASSIVMTFIETISSLSLYGLPVNTADWIDFLSPYAEVAIYFFVGYTVMVITHALLHASYRKAIASERPAS